MQTTSLGKKNNFGFNLIELMAVIAIISVLITLAYPAYVTQLTRARRFEAKVALFKLAAYLEQHYYQRQTYLGIALDEIVEQTKLVPSYYQLHITQVSAGSFRLAAIPQGAQAVHDKLCGALMYEHTGLRQHTGTGSMEDCWGR